MSGFCIVWYCLISGFDMWYSNFISSICMRLVLIDHEYLTGRLCFEISSFTAWIHWRPQQESPKKQTNWNSVGFFGTILLIHHIWAWNSAYSTEQILLGHLATKLHRSKARFLTLILRVTDWKTTLIQTLCLFTLSNAKQSSFAPSCYCGVLLEKYFCVLRALKGSCGPDFL